MTEAVNQMVVTDLDQPIVAIVAMKSQCEAKEIMPGMHLPYYQVTVDPRPCDGTTNGFSPSRAFIRFGRAPGDELQGWQPAHEIEIFEVLAEFEADETIYPQVEHQTSAEPLRSVSSASKIVADTENGG